MKVTPQNPVRTGMESARLGVGPAAPPTPAALRFVTEGSAPIGTGFHFPAIDPATLGTQSERDLSRAASEFAQRMEAVAERSKPSLFNPRGTIAEGAAAELIGDLTRTIIQLNGAELQPDQQSALSQLRKLARSFSEYSTTRPDALIQVHYPYMADVLIDGCKAVLRCDSKPESEPGDGSSLTGNVRTARSRTGSFASMPDIERAFEHFHQIEREQSRRSLPAVGGGSSEQIGLSAHELAACFYAKQYAVATAIAEKVLEFEAVPSRATHRELQSVLSRAKRGLIDTDALSDNPLAIRYNEFRAALADFAAVFSSSFAYNHSERESLVAAARAFSRFLSAEARFGGWAHPGIELTEKGASTAPDTSSFDPSATWSREFRPDRAFKRFDDLGRSGAASLESFDAALEKITARLDAASGARHSCVPGKEPFLVGIYNGKESAELPKRFVDQTVVMQEEHRVPETERGPNCGIMTVAPADEIARWARDATVFSVQKGRELLGALYSFIAQDTQPELTHQLKEIIARSQHAGMLRSDLPIICSELVLSKKAVDESLGRVPENRYVLMNSLWRANVASHYFDHDTVLCLGICRKDPPNTAITAHQRFGWKILPDVEFRFNEKASYYVLYQELHPRESLVANASERRAEIAARPLPRDDSEFGAWSPPYPPAQLLRNFERYSGLPRVPYLRAPAAQLHAYRLAAGLMGVLGAGVAFAPPPENFSHPKEYLLKSCGERPVFGPERKEIELAKQNLSPEARRELLDSCFISVGTEAAIFVDKFYFLNHMGSQRDAALQELREAAARKFPERTIRSAVFDSLKTPETTLLTASISFERSSAHE